MLLQGDMIPWTISQQYQDTEFPRLSGARVVRIAAHPDMTRAGYGTRALELLRRYYEGDLADLVRPQPMLIIKAERDMRATWPTCHVLGLCLACSVNVYEGRRAARLTWGALSLCSSCPVTLHRLCLEAAVTGEGAIAGTLGSSLSPKLSVPACTLP